jgi:diguanylate cyclase (GGDEF)-like protein/PAS domain S-box-containing protein
MFFEQLQSLGRLERAGWRALVTVGALAIAVYVAAWAVLSDEQLRPTARVLMSVCYAAAALLCALRVKSAGSERVAWAIMATAVAVDLLGWLVYWTVIEGLDPVPFPSVADALWLAAYALYYVALLALLRARVARFESSAWLDGAIGALALGALSAVLVFAPVLASTGGNRLAVITNLGYPLGDMLVLSLVVMTFAFSGWRPGRAWLLVGGAMSIKVVADSIYLYQSSAGTWEQGSLLNVSWPAAVLLIALSAWAQPRASAPLELEGWRMMAVPVAFAGIALGVLVYGSVADVSLVTVVLSTCALALAAARSGLTFTRARRLAEHSRRSEVALRQAESRFRSAFEEAPIGMSMIALDGRFLSVNRALCEITGYSRDELETRSFRCITHPDDTSADDEALRAMLAGEIAHQQTEKRYIHEDGRVVPVLLSSTLVRDAVGEPLHVLNQVQDITERKRFEDQLQYLADHDSLTGLFNRRRFEEELTRELANAARYGNRAALLAIDLDNFKYINDSLGHAVGDQLIARLGDALRSRLRRTDVLARLGGDEFAAILPRADEAEALHVAESLLDAVGQIDLEELGGRAGGGASASIGIAVFDGSCGLTPDELLVHADIAMYDAKEAGRARAVVYDGDADGQERMRARMTWVERIRDALASDRFVLYAQPVLALDDDPRPRCELLIRMLAEDGDVVPPASFLPVAERFDLIQEIDRWVLTRAIRVLAAEQSAGREPVLGINLSAKSVTDPDLPDLIARLLREHGADGTGLCFELTETAAIVNLDRARRFASRVGALGCELALDDFGAGFASLYYLKHLEFDVLKIDGEFVKELATSPINQLVVKSVVDIARGLGKRTTAEFVGDAETLDLLLAMGVDYAQGYHIAPPTPFTDDLSVTAIASATGTAVRS